MVVQHVADEAAEVTAVPPVDIPKQQPAAHPASADIEGRVLVIGAGLNGLACGAYLARAGCDVTVLEARDHIGGSASQVRALGVAIDCKPPGYVGLSTSPIVEELQLADHGLSFSSRDSAQIGTSWTGGSPFVMFDDQGRTIDGLGLTHRYEVPNYRSYLATAAPVVDLLLEMELSAPNTLPIRRRFRRRRHSGAATLLKWRRRTAADVQRSLFEDEALRCTSLVTSIAAAGRSPDAPGSGLAAISYALVHLLGTQFPTGGNSAVPDAIAASLKRAGGTIRTASAVERILADDSGIIGVRLDSGEEIRCGAVVVACDPRRAVLHWLKPAPVGAAALIRRWEMASVTERHRSRIDAVLAHLPARRSDVGFVANQLGIDGALPASSVISPTTAALATGSRLAMRGAVAAKPPMMISLSSADDASVSTDGSRHVVSIEVMYTPRELRGGWSGSDHPVHWLDLAKDAFGPDLGSVERWRVVTPASAESSRLASGGALPSFEGSVVSSLVGRRSEATGHITPVDGLYLGCSEVGGPLGLPGISGRNAAVEVLRGLGAGSVADILSAA